MTIESTTAANQLDLLRRAAIATAECERFAQSATPLTTGQAVDIDAALTALVTALSAAGFGAVLPSTQVVVSNAQAVSVRNSALSKTVSGTVAVAGSALTGVTLPATSAIVDSTVVPVVQNSAGTAVPGVNARAVAAGVETSVRTAATVGFVVNGVKQSGWVVTGSGTFFTPTVANGVCTGGVLSAS